MLTRLKVSGFKNLVDVDVHFGPFTCIAGPNGVGKSNLFDAIRFLSALADRTFVDAAKSVRDERGGIWDLLHRVGDRVSDRMAFVAEMIIPPTGTDDLGQEAVARATFLRYAIELSYRRIDSELLGGGLELVTEELDYILPTDAQAALPFPHGPEWAKTAVVWKSKKKSGFIQTSGDEPDRKVALYQDGVQGRPRTVLARQLPRTVLSSIYTAENPTVLLARKEMQSWRLLHLEPTTLRKPAEFLAPGRLGTDGSHLPATLYRLANGPAADGERLYAQVAARLQELIRDVRGIAIDRDDKRELLSLVATDRHGTLLPARALSDGTLRFLALIVMELDPESVGVICFEEPENGIHPARIPAMLKLLKDIAVDTEYPVGDDNPLRQVIVNTHSPIVVSQVEEQDLLAAVAQEGVRDGRRFRNVVFQALSGTWRQKLEPAPQQVALGTLQAYLSPVLADDADPGAGVDTPPTGRRRVRDRPDVQYLFDPCPADS